MGLKSGLFPGLLFEIKIVARVVVPQKRLCICEYECAFSAYPTTTQRIANRLLSSHKAKNKVWQHHLQKSRSTSSDVLMFFGEDQRLVFPAGLSRGFVRFKGQILLKVALKQSYHLL